MCWHQTNPERWKQEQAIAATVLHDCENEIDDNRTAIIHGIFDVYSEHRHIYESVRLRIEYPASFPERNQPPSVYLESHRNHWKNTADSHIEKNWRLCLFVPSESGIDFFDSASLNYLFAIIQTFLFKQRIYQKRLDKSWLTGTLAKWPGEDRSHGEQGILEAIQAKGYPGRNDPCPCGSGKKYKQCHLQKFQL